MPIKKINQNDVLEKYESGKRINQIALELGCSGTNISWILRTKFGYDRRNKTQCKWCPSKEEYSITGVYCIFSLDTRKFYVGSSQDIYQRVVRGHYSYLKRGVAKNKELQKDFNTYGVDGFVCDIWHKCNNKKCCNPEHLYTTNHVENTQYAMDSKRACLTKASPLIFNESAELGR